jgi:hypothetical protein
MEDFFPFAIGVNNSNGCAQGTANISMNFRKKFETALMCLGKLINKKKPEVENLVALSL